MVWKDKMMNKHLKTILKEMFKRVGAKSKFSEKFVKEPQWFMKYEWTTAEQEDFERWLIDYMKNNSEARYELMSRPLKQKKYLEQFASMFILNYGWKQK